jgi:hypothetical protein
MRPARGDAKPCDQPACNGIMRYERPAKRGATPDEEDALRWICSEEAAHVPRPKKAAAHA